MWVCWSTTTSRGWSCSASSPDDESDPSTNSSGSDATNVWWWSVWIKKKAGLCLRLTFLAFFDPFLFLTRDIHISSGYIDLSKRRVSPEEAVKCEDKFTKSKTVTMTCLFNALWQADHISKSINFSLTSVVKNYDVRVSSYILIFDSCVTTEMLNDRR